jgi:hypothetical protein
MFDRTIAQYMFYTCSIFAACSVFMSVFGDALAWYRMPKYETAGEANNHILIDVGFDLIPYYCPRPGDMNVQTLVIVGSIAYNILYCTFIKPQGFAIMQRAFHIITIMIILRTMTLNVTALPNPNPLCVDESLDQLPFFGSGGTIDGVLSEFPSKTCGNLMFSGHTMFITTFALIEYIYKTVPRKLYLFSICKTLIGYYSTISCRSHYTIDVLLGIMLTTMTFFLYLAYFPSKLQITYRTEREIQGTDTGSMMLIDRETDRGSDDGSCRSRPILPR